jgi:hypothetical protein
MYVSHVHTHGGLVLQRDGQGARTHSLSLSLAQGTQDLRLWLVERFGDLAIPQPLRVRTR